MRHRDCLAEAFRPPVLNDHRAELRAFVIRAKPAVYCQGHTVASTKMLADALALLPFRSHVVYAPDGEALIVNVSAVENRVRADSKFAQSIGWRPDRTTIENLDRAFLEGRLLGFILGFPGRAITAFGNHAYRRLPPIIQRLVLRRRVVRVHDPDGNEIYTWVAFGSHDPEEDDIRERVRKNFCG